jgi:glycosidase
MSRSVTSERRRFKIRNAKVRGEKGMVRLIGLVMALAAVLHAQELTLKSEQVSFRFDRLGNIIAITARNRSLTLQPTKLPISLMVDGKWWHETELRTEPLKVQRRDNRIDITARIGDFVVTTCYRLGKGGVLRKEVALRYEGDGNPKIDGARFLLPAVGLGEDAVALSPSFDFLQVPVSQRPRFSVDMGTGAWCALHSPSRKLGIAAAFYSETERFSVNAETVDFASPSSRFFHWLGVRDRVSKGWSADLGTQFFIVAEGDERKLLESLWDAWDLLGLRPLQDTPKDAFDGAFYEPAVQHTYRNIIRLLPHLKRLGVKTIWLPPYTPGIYAPLDYFAIRPEVGTADELKILVNEAHKLGMRVLLDLIPHGPRPESELGKEERRKFDVGLDNWICADEQGRPIHWWGCYAFDYAHPGWIAYMAKVAEHFAREFVIDGWRIDVAGGGPPNWAVVKQTYPRRRPSQSGLWGGLQVLKEARNAVKKVRGEALFYPEVSGPPFVVHGDFDYGFPFYFAAMRLMTMPPEEFVPKLRRWLQHQRYTFPKGGSKRIVRWLANHDNPDVQGRLGFGYSKAMFAVCAFVEGVPFIYEGQDVGMTEFIARVMKLRSALRELRDGEADYLSVSVNDDAVFAAHRFWGNFHTVALVNLKGSPVTVKVRLPLPMQNWSQVGDAWTGEVHKVRKGTVELTLPAFGLALLSDPNRARKLAPKPERFEPVTVQPVTISEEGVFKVGNFVVGQWHEGEFKIAPGERLPFEVAEIKRSENEVIGKLVVKRRMGAVIRTVAEIHWRWTQQGNSWSYDATLQLPIKLARHDFAWEFKFVKPKRWRIATVEGEIGEETVIRYERPHLLWESSRIPPAFSDVPISVQLPDGSWWTLTNWQGGAVQVWLHPDETLIVRIPPNEQGGIAFKFAYGSKPAVRFTHLSPFISFSSAQISLSAGRLRLTLARSLGGLPIRMERLDGNKWQTVLVGSELYSDYGIFPEHDEGGAWRAEGERRLMRTVGRASACRLPDKVELLPNGIAFEGALSTTWAGHWWNLNPRINYRLSYEIDGDGFAVRASVEPVKPMRKVRAFLALTLTFVGVEKVVVNTVKGWHEVPEVGERDWQSRQLPLNTTDPQIRLHTKAGIVALKGIEGELQNCFVLKNGDRCTVFFAWLDGEETDFHARSLRFKVE